MFFCIICIHTKKATKFKLIVVEKWYNNIETENLFLTDVLSVNINTKYHCLQYPKNEMYEKLILRIQGRKILNLL